ncbi:toxin [Eggerthella sinensis]|uniref:toxin n=1 Tax=Eggerthella sinensis TaxID=242230 RepID=UPI0022DF03E7|nr:toxin [Eggerthella sinensis]
MGTIAERWKIEAVLAMVRAVTLERFYVAGSYTYTSKTHMFLKRLGYDDADVHHEVRNLCVEDYAAGPLADDKHRPRDLWVFGKYVRELEVYVKLAVYIRDGHAESVCVSFHEAERPLTYPYRKAG